MNKTKILIANWKMNPQGLKGAKDLFNLVVQKSKKFKKTEIVICPPFCYLPIFASEKSLKLGGQDIFWEMQGAYTGEISGKMLKDIGCQYVIIGHSERRRYFGEDDKIVNLKLKAALGAGLEPIFCVGEENDQEMGQILEQQIKSGLEGIGKNQLKEIIIAYEPVWAIGTGNACLPENALSAVLLIKKIITSLYGRFLAERIIILYGGSVDSKNAADYIKESQTQGFLVGGASLDAEEFVKIGGAINNL